MFVRSINLLQGKCAELCRKPELVKFPLTEIKLHDKNKHQ